MVSIVSYLLLFLLDERYASPGLPFGGVARGRRREWGLGGVEGEGGGQLVAVAVVAVGGGHGEVGGVHTTNYQSGVRPPRTAWYGEVSLCQRLVGGRPSQSLCIWWTPSPYPARTAPARSVRHAAHSALPPRGWVDDKGSERVSTAQNCWKCQTGASSRTVIKICGALADPRGRSTNQRTTSVPEGARMHYFRATKGMGQGYAPAEGQPRGRCRTASAVPYDGGALREPTTAGGRLCYAPGKRRTMPTGGRGGAAGVHVCRLNHGDTTRDVVPSVAGTAARGASATNRTTTPQAGSVVAVDTAGAVFPTTPGGAAEPQ